MLHRVVSAERLGQVEGVWVDQPGAVHMAAANGPFLALGWPILALVAQMSLENTTLTLQNLHFKIFCYFKLAWLEL